jgi:hypothetical protein
MVASMRVTCHHQIPVIDDLSHPTIESMSSGAPEERASSANAHVV